MNKLMIAGVLLCSCAYGEVSQNVAGEMQQGQSKSERVFDLLEGVKLEMIKIPAGAFMMGSPAKEQWRSEDEKQHRVMLSKDFWIGKFEVTQEQYQSVMVTNPSLLKKGARHPVENISWKDAVAFCQKLNKLYEGELPKGYQFDLPTEAQWEYACRAGTAASLNNDKDLTSKDGVCDNLNTVAWYDKNSDKTHHPVGMKKPNAWGVYDMHGNVFELCKDFYSRDYYFNSPKIDPQGASSHSLSLHVLRGGAWDCAAKYSRSASRGPATTRWSSIGFRVALVPVVPVAPAQRRKIFGVF